jgi:tartrate dehydrogenase/decarboxylase/D-malate dehydrogenase
MTNRHHRIALIPGDGIGTEVIPAARRVLDTVGHRHGIAFTYSEFDWSCERYLREGADGLEQLRDHDAILLGAVGYPGVPDHASLWRLACKTLTSRRPQPVYLENQILEYQK